MFLQNTKFFVTINNKVRKKVSKFSFGKVAHKYIFWILLKHIIIFELFLTSKRFGQKKIKIQSKIKTPFHKPVLKNNLLIYVL